MTQEHEQSNVEETAEPAIEADLGQQLRAQREACGLSLENAAERTRIRSAYLRAYEDNDFDRLPSSPYAVGFLRQYAVLLGLDADRVVEDFRRTFCLGENQRKQPLEGMGPNQAHAAKHLLPSWLWWLVVCVVLAVIIGLLAHGSSRGLPSVGQNAFQDPGYVSLLC